MTLITTPFLLATDTSQVHRIFPGASLSPYTVYVFMDTATAGTWDLTIGGETLSGLDWDITPAALKTALETLGCVRSATVGGTLAVDYEIQLVPANGGLTLAVADFASLTSGGSPAVTFPEVALASGKVESISLRSDAAVAGRPFNVLVTDAMDGNGRPIGSPFRHLLLDGTIPTGNVQARIAGVGGKVAAEGQKVFECWSSGVAHPAALNANGDRFYREVYLTDSAAVRYEQPVELRPRATCLYGMVIKVDVSGGTTPAPLVVDVTYEPYELGAHRISEVVQRHSAYIHQ